MMTNTTQIVGLRTLVSNGEDDVIGSYVKIQRAGSWQHDYVTYIHDWNGPVNSEYNPVFVGLFDTAEESLTMIQTAARSVQEG